MAYLVRIKYCGGCNSEYDRVNLVKLLVDSMQQKFPNQIEVTYRNEAADLGIIVCGCPSCCADRSEIKDGTSNWHVIGPGLLDYKIMAQEDIVDNLLLSFNGEGRNTN